MNKWISKSDNRLMEDVDYEFLKKAHNLDMISGGEWPSKQPSRPSSEACFNHQGEVQEACLNDGI